MPDRMSNRMSEDMSDRMPEDLPVRKCINVMVGITRSKVIVKGKMMVNQLNHEILGGVLVSDFRQSKIIYRWEFPIARLDWPAKSIGLSSVSLYKDAINGLNEFK